MVCLLNWWDLGRTGGIADSGDGQVALFFSLGVDSCWRLHLGSLGFMHGEQGQNSAQLADRAAARSA